MKVTNGEVRLMKEALDKLNSLRIPVSVSFKIAKLANKVNRCFNDIEIVRMRLVNQYGEKDKNGNLQVGVASAENQTAFWKEFVELLNEETEIDSDPIWLPENLEIEPSTLMPLEKFIEV